MARHLKDILFELSIQSKVRSIIGDSVAANRKMARFLNARDIHDKLLTADDVEHLKGTEPPSLPKPVIMCRCMAHVIQLLFYDALKRGDTEEGVSDYFLLINKARNLAVYLREASVYGDFEEVQLERRHMDPMYQATNPHTLKALLDCDTRWSSTFAMLTRLVRLSTAIHLLFATRSNHADKADMNLTAQEWTQMCDLVAQLEPFSKMSSMCQLI